VVIVKWFEVVVDCWFDCLLEVRFLLMFGIEGGREI